MLNPKLLAAVALIGCFSLGATTPGVAQQSTSATFQDWLLQCKLKQGSPSQKICVMEQTTRAQNKDQPFSRIVIDKPIKGRPVKLAVQLPVDVSFSANVRILMNKADKGVSAPLDFCVPAGCVARFELKEDILKKFGTTKDAGKISFKDASGHEVSVPLSFKGFHEALDALIAG